MHTNFVLVLSMLLLFLFHRFSHFFALQIVSLTELMAGVKAPTKTVQLFQLTCFPLGHKVNTQRLGVCIRQILIYLFNVSANIAVLISVFSLSLSSAHFSSCARE